MDRRVRPQLTWSCSPRSRRGGRAITDNPHPADDTPAHQDWDFGFRAASAIADNKAIADNAADVH
jgi:hypothetical protein